MLIALLPFYNEEKSIGGILSRLEGQVDHLVIVNDGSFDKSGTFVSAWIRNKENVSYISYAKNKGMSYALLQGFIFILEQTQKQKFSNEDAVLTIDADDQHDPNDVSGMYDYFKDKKLDVLVGRRDFSVYPKYRIVGNKLLSFIASRLGGFRFNDIECGMKILKISFIKNLLDYYCGFRYSCASEIGIIASRKNFKLDNDYFIKVGHYRNKRGPKIFDFFLNIIFCLRAWLLTFLKN